MTESRLRTLVVLLRYLRECDDPAGRALARQLAAFTVAMLTRVIVPERPCRMSLRELLTLPPAGRIIMF